MFKGLWFFCKFGWKTDKRYIAYNIFYQFINSLIPIVTVTMPKFIIDELLGHQRIDNLILYVCILVGYNFLANSLSNYFRMSSFTLRCKVAAEFGIFMHKKLANADFEKLESPDFLDMKEKANKFLYGDWHGFSYVFDSALLIVGKFITLTGIIAIVATLNIGMVLLFIVLVLINSGVEGWAKRNELELSLEQVKVERRWKYYSKLFEDFKYGKEVRINTLGDWLLAQEAEYAKKAIDYYRQRNSFYIKYGTFASLVTLIQQCAAYTYLIYRIIIAAISIGDFTMYVGAVAAFSGAMRAVMSGFVEIKAYGVYYDAMHNYLNVPNSMRENTQLPLPQGNHELEFRDVSFRYMGQETFALKNINIVLKPGEKLAIVGENGAGKTTFIKLLTRLYDPTEGEILLDGVAIKDIDYDSYMSLFSTVFQDYKLFSFSIRDNIRLSKNGKDIEIEKVLHKVGLSDKLKSLPHGIHTSIYKAFDGNGFEPSGGEGQKIALARALYKNAPIVVLDEPTAALDPQAEYDLYQRFNELVNGKTAVYISHRLASTKFCDKIAVFSSGEIVEHGTHNELISRNGLYKRLFEMQAQFYNDPK